MKTKMFRYVLLIVIVASLSIGFVSASDLEVQNFDSHFSIAAPANADFQNATLSNDKATYFVDSNNYIWVIYYQNQVISQNTVNSFYTGLDESGTFTQEGNNGNLTLFHVNDKNLGYYGVAVSSGNQVVIITGKDLNLLEAMGKSVDFS